MQKGENKNIQQLVRSCGINIIIKILFIVIAVLLFSLHSKAENYDFIFGEATALFEACELHCKANSFITAASTREGKPFGFVFLKCRITASSGVNKVFLGRPWRSFAKVAFLNCEMGSFIAPEGWDNWSKSENEQTAVFAEFNNTGAGAGRLKRVGWSWELTEKEAGKFMKEVIFAPLNWEISSGKKWYE